MVSTSAGTDATTPAPGSDSSVVVGRWASPAATDVTPSPPTQERTAIASAPPPAPAQPPEKTPFVPGVDGTGGTLTAAFLHAVGRQMGDRPLDADALARAAAQLLPVDGAGITVLVDDLRLPLGASSSVVQRAEELQSSLGDGPCLSAAEEKTALVADLPELLRRWPLYATELVRRTPFRSAAAVPLRTSDGQVFAALDLMSEEPDLSHRLDLDEVDREIGTSLGALLDLSMRPSRDSDGLEVLPRWYEQATARRQDVWVAVGMVMGHLHRPGSDALSLLRAYAYRHDGDLDAVAAAVVDRDLPVQDLTG